MDPEISFFFYLGAVICFVLAALGEGWRYGHRTRAGLKPSLTLLPLGLALAFIPLLWDTGVAAFWLPLFDGTHQPPEEHKAWAASVPGAIAIGRSGRVAAELIEDGESVHTGEQVIHFLAGEASEELVFVFSTQSDLTSRSASRATPFHDEVNRPRDLRVTHLETASPWGSPAGSPSQVRLLRRVPVLWRENVNFEVSLEELAGSLGLGRSTGRNGSLQCTLDRLVRFRFAAVAHVIRHDDDRVRAILDESLGGSAEGWLRTEDI